MWTNIKLTFSVDVLKENNLDATMMVDNVQISIGNKHINLSFSEMQMVVKDMEYVGACLKISNKILSKYIGNFDKQYSLTIVIPSNDLQNQYYLYFHPDKEGRKI